MDAQSRPGSGRHLAKKLFKQGLVPAILFKSGAKVGELLTVTSLQMEALVRVHGHTGAGSRVLTLNFDGGRQETVIAKQIMQHGVTRAVNNVCFMPCDDDTMVKVNVRRHMFVLFTPCLSHIEQPRRVCTVFSSSATHQAANSN